MCNPLLTNPWSRQAVSMQQLVFLTLCIFIFKNEHCKNHTTMSASSIFWTASHSTSFSVCQDEVWTFFTLWWKMYWVSSVLTSMGAQKLWLQGCRHRFSPSDSVSVVPEVSLKMWGRVQSPRLPVRVWWTSGGSLCHTLLKWKNCVRTNVN